MIKQFDERKEKDMMMTRPDVLLKSLLLHSISHGALDYTCTPKIFAVRIAADYGAGLVEEHLALAPYLKGPLSFLAWVQMWLRLVLGLEERAEPSCYAVGTYAVPAISYPQVEPGQLNKPAAHNLEALMRFAPDGAGQGLTLNQYRERFTRLSVMGRVQIYKAMAGQALFWRGCMLDTLGAMSLVGTTLCHAPLRPD